MLKLADTPVGGATGPGLSGGQKKRLVVALQLLKLPSVIFLDEPTSGKKEERKKGEEGERKKARGVGGREMEGGREGKRERRWGEGEGGREREGKRERERERSP